MKDKVVVFLNIRTEQACRAQEVKSSLLFIDFSWQRNFSFADLNNAAGTVPLSIDFHLKNVWREFQLLS